MWQSSKSFNTSQSRWLISLEELLAPIGFKIYSRIPADQLYTYVLGITGVRSVLPQASSLTSKTVLYVIKEPDFIVRV